MVSKTVVVAVHLELYQVCVHKYIRVSYKGSDSSIASSFTFSLNRICTKEFPSDAIWT